MARRGLLHTIIIEVDRANKKSQKEREKAQREYEKALIRQQKENEKEREKAQREYEKEQIKLEKEREKRLALKVKQDAIKAKEYFKKELDRETQVFETRINNRKALCIKMIREVLK